MIDPAFPVPMLTNGEGVPKWPGLSIRDYMAAAALNGRLQNQRLTMIEDWTDEGAKRFAEDAYKMADAMIAARAVETKP